MKVDISRDDNYVRITATDCTPKEFLDYVQEIKLPSQVTITSMIDSKLKEGRYTIRCYSDEDALSTLHYFYQKE